MLNSTRVSAPSTSLFLSLLVALICLTAEAQHQQADSKSSKPPFVAPASAEGELAIKKFQVAPGLKADLWAAEPMLANPVAFNFDEQGRAYVCETFRLNAGVDDIHAGEIGRAHV